MIQKFYKLFTWSVLILIGIFFSSTLVSSQANTPLKQNNCLQDCCGQQLVVLENAPDKTIHMIYDFTRGNATSVTIRKGFLPPEVIVQTKKLY